MFGTFRGKCAQGGALGTGFTTLRVHRFSHLKGAQGLLVPPTTDSHLHERLDFTVSSGRTQQDKGAGACGCECGSRPCFEFLGGARVLCLCCLDAVQGARPWSESERPSVI